ncbi:hypothetical protein Nepgr_023150 [Nepenthes gracilis]|uniref:Uncharacterized protein n=1 Tax=Nepenthes gracilis TaxID=150966 RepID=A0AAD3T1I5_NEPGR|nr:hypothetical protein Nepgr_023150 [Nepenthes gracilis]
MAMAILFPRKKVPYLILRVPRLPVTHRWVHGLSPALPSSVPAASFWWSAGGAYRFNQQPGSLWGVLPCLGPQPVASVNPSISPAPTNHLDASACPHGVLWSSGFSRIPLVFDVVAESPKVCDMEVSFSDRVGGDQKLVSGLVDASLDQGCSCSQHVDSLPSPSRDLVSSDGVDERLINPTPAISSIAHLSPVGQVSRDNSALSPLIVDGLQGYGGSDGEASISFAYVLKRGILSMDVDVSGARGVQKPTFTDMDSSPVEPSLGRNVGSLVSGFVGNTLEVCSETEHPNLLVLNCQPGLDNPHQSVADDRLVGVPSAGRLKRNLEEIRKRFNAYRARHNRNSSFFESRPDSTLIFEDSSSNKGVSKTPSPLPIEGLSPSYDSGDSPSSLSMSFFFVK